MSIISIFISRNYFLILLLFSYKIYEFIILLAGTRPTDGINLGHVVLEFFPKLSVAPSGGRRPLEIKYTFPNTLSRVVSEYIWLGDLFPKS